MLGLLLSQVLHLLFLLLWDVDLTFFFFFFAGALHNFGVLPEEQGSSLISSLFDSEGLPVIFTTAGLAANKDCFLCGVSI